MSIGCPVCGGGGRGTWAIVLDYIHDYRNFIVHSFSHWPILDSSAQARTSRDKTANGRWLVEIIVDPRVLIDALRPYQQVPDSVQAPDG